MKSFLAFLVLAAGGYYYYNHFVAPPPAPHRFSSDDVFYLRQYVTVKTSRGPIGWVPGQELKLCAARVPGKIVVTDGAESMPLTEDLLTHDMDEAAALRASDTQSQAALQEEIDQTKHLVAAREAKAHAMDVAAALHRRPGQ